ncbi:MAG: DUF3376 domain-containing protein [Candidatus Brocadia sp.]|nr:DUF3376 domain-containing protein [Candidatus Brocadia sp.]UJS17910.1 MAG: DUF3376 domain-containing protein [Candidatus Jettenia sp.]
MQESSGICKETLNPGSFPEGSPQQVARQYLWHYYKYYDDYDMITFPILYCTEAGETDTVEIIRISPEDAKSLIDEEDERKKQNGRSKLAGTAFANFGAFFERFWRQNDMLWGRLDSAERLITTLLPGDQHNDDRKRLLEEAQETIIAEELKPRDHQEICKLLADALAGANSMDKAEKYLQKLIEAECGSPINPKLQAILRSCLNEKKLLSYLRDGYEVNREPNHKTLLTSLSRSSQVIGKMLEGLADKYYKQSKSIAWMTRLRSYPKTYFCTGTSLSSNDSKY